MSIDYAQIAANWIGSVGLFLGTETGNWTVDDFSAAAQWAKSQGVDSLYVKCADGTNQWYGGIGNFRAIHDAINAAGCGAVPYVYSYGDKFGGLDGEIAIIESLMRTYGGCIVDMEIEWNGQVSWAARMEAALRPVPGLMFVSTWGDPVQQNWIQVLNTLAPCVNAFMPQYYSDFLVSCFDQYGSLIQFPTLDAAAEFGPNNVVANVIAMSNKGVKSISFWEYSTVRNAVAALQQAVKLFNQPTSTPKPVSAPTPTPPGNAHMEKAMQDCWNSSPVKGLNYNSGIAGSWKDEYKSGRYRGPALTGEYQTVDYAGNAIIAQEFPGGRCEHSVKTGANVWINRP